MSSGLTQQFMLEVRDSQTSELRANYSSPVPRFTVNSLMPSAIYLASVYAFNTKGKILLVDLKTSLPLFRTFQVTKRVKKLLINPLTDYTFLLNFN